MDIVHVESIERLIIDDICNNYNRVKKLKNLKYLFTGGQIRFDPTFLFHLRQLKEIHLSDARPEKVLPLFEQKQRYGRACLKIYLCGLLLNGPRDPVIGSLDDYGFLSIRDLSENHWKLANEVPFWTLLHWEGMGGICPEVLVFVLNRLIDLRQINAEVVEDHGRFLNLLEKLNNIEALEFYFDFVTDYDCDLLYRLQNHCAIQRLHARFINDWQSILSLGDLVNLSITNDFAGDVEPIREIFEALHFLSSFEFCFNEKCCKI